MPWGMKLFCPHITEKDMEDKGGEVIFQAKSRNWKNGNWSCSPSEAQLSTHFFHFLNKRLLFGLWTCATFCPPRILPRPQQRGLWGPGWLLCSETRTHRSGEGPFLGHGWPPLLGFPFALLEGEVRVRGSEVAWQRGRGQGHPSLVILLTCQTILPSST